MCVCVGVHVHMCTYACVTDLVTCRLVFAICRIWDLSLEKDEEEEAEFKAKMKEQVNAPEDLPPQLLFVHQVLLLPF